MPPKGGSERSELTPCIINNYTHTRSELTSLVHSFTHYLELQDESERDASIVSAVHPIVHVVWTNLTGKGRYKFVSGSFINQH